VTPTVANSGATVTVSGAAVTSGSSSGEINLSVGVNTIPVVVTAQDESTNTYIVTVTRAANPAKAITSFNFDGLIPNVTGTVNEGAKTIALTVPYGTDVDALVPTITHTGAAFRRTPEWHRTSAAR
jgi:hypothetical protein